MLAKVLVQLSLKEIIDIFVFDKEQVRPIIYNNLPGLVMKEGVDIFVQQLINMNEKELVRRAMNQLYNIDNNITHYTNVLHVNKEMFIYILPSYVLDGLLDKIPMDDDYFLIMFTKYSMRHYLIDYLRMIVQINTKNSQLKKLIHDALIIVTLC
jgi:hypothetical protein